MQILKCVLLVGVVCLFVTGCSGGYIANFEIGLNEADRPTDAQEQFGEQVVRTVEEMDQNYSHFEDGMVSVSFKMKPKVFEVEIVNKLDKPITVDWDRAQYVDENGETHRLIHEDVLKKDIDKPQEPVTIEAGTLWKEKVQSRENLTLVTGIHQQWQVDPFFPYQNKSEEKLKGQVDGLTGKIIKIKLPFIVEGAPLDYTFGFLINKITVEKARPEEDKGPSTNYHDQFEHSS